jgi:Domain of unknown function (DUF4331)
MPRWRALSRIQRPVTFMLIAGALAGGVRYATGSDHQDTPLVELNPRMDLTDVYAFPSPTPGRIVLVMNTSGFLDPADTPSAAFDPNILYQFKVDNDGDAKEDRVIQVTFSGKTTDQRVTVHGPFTPATQGAMMNAVAQSAATVSGKLNTAFGSAGGLQAFAGPRDDPFFLDLEAAFCILPDRRPAAGALAAPCRLPSVGFRNPGVNYIAGYNVLSIVVELPSAMLEHGAPGKLGIWGTISR